MSRTCNFPDAMFPHFVWKNPRKTKRHLQRTNTTAVHCSLSEESNENLPRPHVGLCWKLRLSTQCDFAARAVFSFPVQLPASPCPWGTQRGCGSGLGTGMRTIYVAYIYDSVFFLRDNFDITKAINRTPRAEKYRKEE